VSVPPQIEYLEALLGEETTRAAYRYFALLLLALIVSAMLYPFAWRETVRIGIVAGLILYAAVDLPRTVARARARKRNADDAFNYDDSTE
jgi:hypothetical protein